MMWLRRHWRTAPQVALSRCGRAVSFVWTHAWGAHVPLIWHIIVIGGTALGTFFLTPALAEKFERQKIRSSYVSSNLQEMNKLTGDFYVAVMKATSAPCESRVEKFAVVDEIAARLTWKSIEIGAVLRSPADQRLMGRFAVDLEATQRAAANVDASGGRQRFTDALTRFSEASVLVIQGVAERAELSNELEQPGSS